MTSPNVMIFAAGFGTRMMPLTRDRPKPMVPILGRPLVDYALDHARALSPAKIVVNTHYKAKVLMDHLRGSDVHILNETPDILDTGGGLRNALPVLGPDPVITMNPDVLWFGPNPLQLALDRWRPEEMDALLVCIPAARTHATDTAGDFRIDPDGRITRGPGYVYGGVQILKTEGLHDIPDTVFSLNVLWDRFIETGTCRAAIYPGHWCDVGHPAAIEIAEALLKDQQNV